jgi:Cu2+-exporting ATPase
VDKTGTLTEAAGSPELAISVLTGAESAATLRAVAATLAKASTHPIARALADPLLLLKTDFSWRELRETAGAGLEGLDENGARWRLGSAAWAGAAGTDGEAGRVWLSREGVPLARFDFEERLREDSVATLRLLEQQGLAISLLSGDTPARAQTLAARLGIADCRGGLSPEAKLAAVREAQARGEVVVMLGDGVNDAPVLAQADAALAMGGGAALARNHADAVLLGDSLRGAALARELARRTMRVIRQNLFWAAAYNAACVPLALLGMLPPLAAGLGMAASSLVVVFNSLRLAR